MTEKDLQESTESGTLEESITEKNDQVTEVELGTSTEEDLTEESQTETAPSEEIENTEESDASEESEEPSAFLLQWQKRHEAYLAKQQKTSETEQSTENKEPKSGRPSIFKKKSTQPQIDQLTFETDETDKIDYLEGQKDPIPSSAIWKAVPVYAISLTFLILSIYFISPFGKQKNIIVKGNQHIETANVIKDSLISNKDYILSTFINISGHERNIKHSSSWIKDVKIDYTFPNRFTINIEEYSQIAFVKQGEEYYSALSSGEISETPTPFEQLPESYTIIHLTDKDLVKKLALQLATVDNIILSDIQDIQLTPSKVTNDLLTLNMKNGNKILVPLSDIETKLPYYEKIASQLQVVSIIDMEVGIFSYASE